MKAKINDSTILNCNVKPKILYEKYEHFMKDADKKTILNKTSFLAKLKDAKEYIEFRENIRGERSHSPSNYVYIDRDKMIQHFKSKFYLNEYDDIQELLETEEDIVTNEDTSPEEKIKRLQDLILFHTRSIEACQNDIKCYTNQINQQDSENNDDSENEKPKKVKKKKKKKKKLKNKKLIWLNRL
jgi:hypothetical protein